MTTLKLNLSSTCHFERVFSDDGNYDELSLEYVEHSSDHWHSDEDTSISLTEEDAMAIIAFLEDWIKAKEKK